MKAYRSRFIVKDSNGNPVEGANITLTKGSATITEKTREDGVYEVYLLTGEWSVQISKTEYKSYSGTANVVAADNSFPVTLADATYTSKFTVVDQDGYAVPGATITLTKGSFSYTGTTDSSGLCSVELIKGTYSLDITKTEYNPLLNDAVTIVSAGNNNFTKTLTVITYDSTFTVKNSGGALLQGATVTLTSATGVQYDGITNASGVCIITMPAGHFSSLTQLAGYDDDTTSFDIASGGSSKTITLTSSGSILVYTREAHSGKHGTTYTPLNNVMIRVTRSSPAYDTQISTGSGSNADGYALFSSLTPGTYTVMWGEWDHSHYNWHDSHNVTVTAGNTSNYTYTFN
jgi:hypothetical protein